MSVPYLKEAVQQNDNFKLIRFVRLHFGDGNDEIGRKEIDKSWVEALKVLLHYDDVDQQYLDAVLRKDDATLAQLYFRLHFHFIRKSGEWIHDGSR